VKLGLERSMDKNPTCMIILILNDGHLIDEPDAL
jgi:hypothetical protein